MQHLNLEELARLVDEKGAEEERAHLAGCEPCRLELQAMREQTETLANLPDLAAPEGGWDALERRLQAEGLLLEGAPRLQRRWRDSPALRAAAALLLFAAGAATGWSVRAEWPIPIEPTRLGVTAGGTAEEALRSSEAAYLAALVQYAESIGAVEAGDPLNQLATLEGIVLTTRAGLEESPADPIINGYHLAALGQREALLKRIGRSSEAEWF